MSVAAKWNLLGLEEVGTNFVVRRKTLFESAERADWLRIFFIWMVRGCGAQILRHRYFTYSGEVTLHARGEAGSLLSMGYARTAPYYIGRWSGYLTRAGAGGDRHLLHRMGRKRRRNRGGAIFFLKRTEKDLHGFCRICNFASGMKPSFHFSPVLSGTLEHPYIRLERNEKEDFFVKFLII